ncbi:hypothetical protein CC80DRAFT_236421 [Byssothecium circinans]|uniref:Uncharacterized protein n=1 Tax=Byssothecium circinans TaxID=147558 RepID=A0A6A5UBQ3_9PLEO|nr:hypothetical protein CC80DRAFT_236421 [Byssothecium circinans]
MADETPNEPRVPEDSTDQLMTDDSNMDKQQAPEDSTDQLMTDVSDENQVRNKTVKEHQNPPNGLGDLQWPRNNKQPLSPERKYLDRLRDMQTVLTFSYNHINILEATVEQAITTIVSLFALDSRFERLIEAPPHFTDPLCRAQYERMLLYKLKLDKLYVKNVDIHHMRQNKALKIPPWNPQGIPKSSGISLAKVPTNLPPNHQGDPISPGTSVAKVPSTLLPDIQRPIDSSGVNAGG